MKVILAEKPSVGREIAHLLGANNKKDGYIEGNGYAVTWAFGHLVQLAMPEAYGCVGFQKEHLPILPEPFELQPRQVRKDKGYVADAGVLKQLKVIRTLFEQCDSIVVATDAGREGELIFRYIYDYLNCQKPFERLWISSLTEKAILSGFEKLRPGKQFDPLYHAAQMRSQADWLVGINATQALSIAAGSGVYSLGRVQTPTLSMVCERYLTHTQFEKKPYWQLQLVHQKGHLKFNSLSTLKTEQKEEVEEWKKSVERHPNAEVLSVEKKTVKEQPPLLYDLTALQKEANKKYSFSADETLNIAQSLYEKKYITYPRTGSKYISEDVWAEIPLLIQQLEHYETYAKYAQQLRHSSLTKRIVNDVKVTDHHGLLITDKIPTELPKKEALIYKMIAGRLLEAVSEICIKETQIITVEAGYKNYEIKGCTIQSAGWRAVNGSFSEIEKEEEIPQELPELQKGDTLKVMDSQILSKTTRPPALYTEATLLSAMESAGKDLEDENQRQLLKGTGIGTPATRATIIETLLKRNYIKRQKKSIIPTEKGLKVYEWVKDRKIADVALTGEWEASLNEIEEGQLPPENFLQAMKDYTQKITEDFLTMEIEGIASPALVCPVCKKQSVRLYKKVAKCMEEDCQWLFFRNVCGKQVNDEAIMALLENGKTTLLKGLKSKAGKSFDAYLVLQEDSSTSFEFPPRSKNKKGKGK
ncbi:DNA topoisomerase 3 [Riemerella anatipestifer]|uniref:type IA DNA topoisomerase n=1 Tax=Riemerella anatipestifer TaxID=34085 RepID=UPI0007EC4AB6|nr:type IA DNA topoisomerase [Riemerella anatipestifer]AZZ58454.1 type IA DNA topoisomerase [Riemerella anatipestifer]MCO7319097.1 DNA topoisomerase 3 [Riemerella anatipestifer]MCQ4155349.1 DNA topoisomerase 3 [Riemerella anatipestifer]MCQ4181349.1 DNA topoisomerase 3 [Riemerella anatipestifer]MCW0474593.1 DNA topoisomerase 3 [Riemerella anatipestifer]